MVVLVCVWLAIIRSGGCVFFTPDYRPHALHSRGDLISGGRPLVAGVYAVICCGCMTEYRL